MPISGEIRSAYPLTEGSAVLSTSSLFSFSRNVTTVDPLGEQCAANVIRFGPDQTLAGLIGDAQTCALKDTASPPANAVFYGSATAHAGLDVDGKTLLIVKDYPVSGDTNVRLRAWTSSSTTSNTWTAHGERVCYRPSGLPNNGMADVRYAQGAGPSTDDGKLFDPRCIQVINGTIVVFCEVYIKTGSPASWATPKSAGCGWVVLVPTGSDYLAGTQYLYDDSSLENNLGRTRVAAWSFTQPYAPFHTSGDVLEVWPCAVDYQYGPGSGNDIKPNGGVAYWFKMTRSSGSARFSPVLDGSAIKVARQSPGPLALDSPYGYYMHRHQIALVKQVGSADKMVAIMAEGDDTISSITRIFNIDRTNYTGPSGYAWDVQYDQHGRMDSGARSAASPLQDNRTGNQFVAACPGPEAGQALVGADQVTSGIDLLDVGVPGSGGSPPTRLRHITVHSIAGIARPSYDDLDGSGSSPHRYLAGWTSRRPNIFHLRAEPLGGNERTVVASVDCAAVMQSQGAWPALNHFAVSPASGAPGTWSDFQAPPEADPGHIDAGVQLANDMMYSRTVPASATCSIIRYGFGATVSGRPMLVSPARANYWHGASIPDSVSNSEWVECQKLSGLFMEASAPGVQPTVSLSPQPPIWHDPTVSDPGDGSIVASTVRGRVFRLRSKKKLNSTSAVGAQYLAQIKPGISRTGGTVPAQFRGSPWGDAAGNYTGGITARIWVLNASDDPDGYLASQSLPPSIPALNRQWESLHGTADGQVTIVPAGGIATNNVWVPICLQGPISKDSSATEILDLYQPGDVASATESIGNSDTELYVAFDMLSPGYGGWGYPTPPAPTASSSTSGTQPVSPAYPNELAKLINLGVTTGTWTVMAAGCVTDDDWDQCVYGSSGRNPLFPLLMAYGDADNYALVSASPFIESESTFAAGSPASSTISKHSQIIVSCNRKVGGSQVGGYNVLNQACFLRRAPLILALVWTGTKLRLYATTGGTYLGYQEVDLTLTGSTNMPLSEIRFFDQSNNVGAFQWFGAGAMASAWSEADVKAAMRTLDFMITE